MNDVAQIRSKQLEDWLKEADQTMATLRKQLAKVVIPQERTALQQRIKELSQDISAYENKLVQTQIRSRSNSDPAYLYLNLANNHFALGNFELAIGSYTQALDSSKNAPPLANLYLERAETYAQLGWWDKSLEDYEQFDKANNHQHSSRKALGKGIALYYLNELEEAKREFKLANEIASKKGNESDQFKAQSYLGAIATVQQNFDEAVKHYKRALFFGEIATNSQNLARLHYNLATLLREDEQLEEAEAHYNQARQLDPQNADVFHGLALLYRDRGDLNAANVSLQQALKLEPDRPDLLVSYGTNQLRLRNYEETSRAYRQALESGWSEANVFDGLGTCELAHSNFSAAETAFRRAIELDSTSAFSWGNLGAVLFRQNKIEEATEAYQQAIQTGNAKPVEEAWLAILQQIQSKQISNAALKKLETGENRQFYEFAEYEATLLVLQAATVPAEQTVTTILETFRQKLSTEIDALATFYWQNGEQAVRAIQTT
ncbi:MAG: tetratricopeptide repeat protein [Chloroflexota bacterium]